MDFSPFNDYLLATCSQDRSHWISDLNIGAFQSCGNQIKASGTLMAFNVNGGNGSNLCVLPIDFCGRSNNDLPGIKAHSDLVTDMDFSPFNDYLLATCSQDRSIKLWDLPEGGLTEDISTALLTLPMQDKRVENVLFHPAADSVLASTIHKTIKIWDISTEQEKLAWEGHEDQLLGISWKQDGTLLASTGKDKKIKIWDPRNPGNNPSATGGHDNHKDSRVCWLGNEDLLLSSGFNKTRQSELIMWDARNLGASLTSQAMGTSTSALIPFYDADTKMLFIASKGATSVTYMEVTNSQPYITQNSVYMGNAQQKGVAMVPKRALNVMSCEVNRLLQLTKNAILPLSYEVPRRSHREFASELFPDTPGYDPAMTATEWFQGESKEVAKMSLDPSKRPPVTKKSCTKGGYDPAPTPVEKKEVVSIQKPEEKPFIPANKPTITQNSGVKPVIADNKPSLQGASASGESIPVKRPSGKKFVVAQTSKYRHAKGSTRHASSHITNIRNIGNIIFGECDGFHANIERAAVPFAGAGGQIGIFELNKPGRQPESEIPAIQNQSMVQDFRWDPFNNHRLVIAGENCRINVFDIPEGGLVESINEPTFYMLGHQEKIHFIIFHPLAKDMLLSASLDLTIRIWNLETRQEVMILKGHTDQIYAACWSSDGTRVATLCKDKKLRIYDPRQSNMPIKEVDGVNTGRCGRVVWVCQDQCILVSGFNRNSSRQISLYSVSNLSKTLSELVLHATPAILIPYYDEDTNVVFLYGKVGNHFLNFMFKKKIHLKPFLYWIKVDHNEGYIVPMFTLKFGDVSIYILEVSPEEPYIFECSPFKLNSNYQAVSFLPKVSCVVKDVEFARAVVLTKMNIEPISIIVPRVKKWESTLSCDQWFKGQNSQHRTIPLCPEGMQPLSTVPKSAPAPKKYESHQELERKTDEQKKEELLNAMVGKLGLREDEPLPQEEFEGVDEDEWDD
ncbi:coronin-7-like [Anneissia japonica]|uniref:coronin-7-like n=1 Tax=Anneissia japonica TaxID=1529436 RepID=UPI0014258E84|nr:coronin-7-like [Anneissia japonica]